jgi:AraC-like DNA-binding protein/quercetin dioxygenase-like cupin family protein
MMLVLRSAAVTVSARPAKDPPGAANVDRVDLRGASAVRAGTYAFDGADVVTDWHTHELHQIEYAFEGVVEVETAKAHFLLPPHQAIWIPAGLPHRTTLRRVRTMSVFFEPNAEAAVEDRARVLAAAPVVREMILYAGRWPIDRVTSDPGADAYFDVLSRLARTWVEHEPPLSLPVSSDPVIAAVMHATQAALADITAAALCRAVGISPRTLRRRFPEATGTTWRRYLHHSRLLRAMALLAESNDSVVDVATAVGFASTSAFTRAFAAFGGDTPTAYRRRIRHRPS